MFKTLYTDNFNFNLNLNIYSLERIVKYNEKLY